MLPEPGGATATSYQQGNRSTATAREARIKKRDQTSVARYWAAGGLDNNLSVAKLPLIPGTGESGKSTFIKQMRIIHGSGYNEADRTNFKATVYRNVIVAIQAMVTAMSDLQIPYASGAAQEAATQLESIAVEEVQTIDAGAKSAIQLLWRDGGVRQCYQRRREYQISDSAK